MIFPYTHYGIATWGQAAQVFILQKRALRLMFFAGNRSHATPLFVFAKVLPLNMLYFKKYALLYTTYLPILRLRISVIFFTRSSDLHTYNTRFSDAGFPFSELMELPEA